MLRHTTFLVTFAYVNIFGQLKGSEASLINPKKDEAAGVVEMSPILKQITDYFTK